MTIKSWNTFGLLKEGIMFTRFFPHAPVAELVDATDSKAHNKRSRHNKNSNKTPTYPHGFSALRSTFLERGAA